MTTFIWPAALTQSPVTQTLDLEWNEAVFESIFTRVPTIQRRTGNRWRSVIVFPPLGEVDARELGGFLLKLQGRVHRVALPYFDYTRGGTGVGTPLVDGAAQTGSSLNTKGWGLSQTVLKRGDFFVVDTGSPALPEMHRITDDAASDGAGLATLTFEPEIRTAPAGDKSIGVTNIVGNFMLISATTPQGAREPGIFAHYTLEFVEDPYHP